MYRCMLQLLLASFFYAIVVNCLQRYAKHLHKLKLRYIPRCLPFRLNQKVPQTMFPNLPTNSVDPYQVGSRVGYITYYHIPTTTQLPHMPCHTSFVPFEFSIECIGKTCTGNASDKMDRVGLKIEAKFSVTVFTNQVY